MDVLWTSLKVVFTAFVSLSLMSSCTRSGGSSSQVSLTFPQSKQMSQSGTGIEIPVHIAVNVSASDMTTVYWSWDNNNNSSTPKTTAVVSVPQGSARLIQVMYVTQDDSNNLYFYYGDSTQDLLVPNPSVSMSVNALTSSSTQGKIVGRYVNATGGGPTGILNSYFTPGPGKPAMIVDQNEIFGGWFKAFSLPTNPFTYKADDGTVVLADYAAAPAFVTGQSSALINIPAAYRIYSGQSSTNYNSAETILAGFFGPGAGSKKMCVASASGVTIPYLFADMPGTTPITWNGSLSACASNQACLIQGGISAATTPCVTPDNINYMKLHELLLAGDDSSMMFKGPFLMADLGSGSSAELGGTLSGSTLALTWQFMPGAAAGLDGIELFYKWDSSSNSNGNPAYKSNNGYACSQLVSTYGFTSGGKFGTSTTSGSVTVGTGTQGQTLVALACPYSNSRNPIYFTTAAQYNYMNNTPITNQIVLTDATGHPSTATQNVCKAYNLNLLTGGLPSPDPSGMSVTLMTNSSPTYAGSGFSLSSGCTAPSANLVVPFSSGVSSMPVYFYGTGNAYFNVSTSTTTPSFMGAQTTIGVVPAAYPAATSINFAISAPYISGYNRLASGSCYPITANLVASGSLPTIGGGSATLQPISGGLSGYIYSGASCSGTALNTSHTGVATITIPAGDTQAMYSFMPDVITTTTGGAQIAATGISPTSASGIYMIDAAPAIQAAPPNAYSIMTMGTSNFNGSYDPGACVPVSISAANAVAAPIQVTSSQTIGLSASGGVIYSDFCGGTIATSATLSPQMSTVHVYVQMAPSAASGTFTVTDPTTNTQTLNLTLNQPALIKWASSTMPMATGICYAANFSAWTASNQPYNFPTAYGGNLSASGVYFYTDPGCVSSATVANFSAGTNTSGSGLYMLVPSTSPPSLSIGSNSVDMTGITLVQTLMTPQNMAGACSGTGAAYQFNIGAPGVTINVSQIPTRTSNLTITSSPTVFGCTDGTYTTCNLSYVTLSLTNNTTLSSAMVYFKPSGPTTSSMSLSATGLPGINWSNNSFTCP